MMRERTNQKARTRAALLAAARELSEKGQEITVLSAAERAGMSKATAYRYFSDPVTLASEAALDIRVTPTESLLDGETDVRRRVHLVTDFYREFSRRNEPAFRKFMAKLMADWTPGRSVITRGARRIPALDLALAPARADLTAEDFNDLVLALSTATGFEQHTALADVCGLPPNEADRIGRIVVDAILDRYLPPAV